MVNVTRTNFVEQSNDLLKHLPTASFVAIDEEMTGISMPGTGRPAKEQSPSQRYPILKQAAERYSIIQLGISLFHPAEDSEDIDWHVRRYNFYMFPAGEGPTCSDPREVVMNPSTVAFLNEHNMSFDVWVKEGVPFQTASEAQETLNTYIESQKKAMEQEAANEAGNSPPATVQETVRRRIELRRVEDIEFYARAMASLREWLDAAHPVPANADAIVDEAQAEAQGMTFLLPSCNSFMRRAFYESIGKEYPSLELESAGPDHPNQIRVWRLTPEEKIYRRKRLRQEAWNKVISGKLGMWRVFEALSRVSRGEELLRDSILFASSYDQINWNNPGKILDVASDMEGQGRKIPIVVHNGFMDICFLLSHFHSRLLPDQLSPCKALIRSYFPIIYDTKIVCTECSSLFHNENSNLSGLFQKIVVDGGNGLLERMLIIQGEDEVPDQQHEAAYDAYMTGCVYIRLCNSIKEFHPDGVEKDEKFGTLTHLASKGKNHDDQVKLIYGRNKLYQMSMYTMDLEDLIGDPLSRGMSPASTYRVSGIDPSVSTRDIVRCLSGLVDSAGRRVNYEIIWVDDTTFLVAASYRPPPPAAAEEGEVVSDPTADATPDVLSEHGRLVLEVLQRRFQKETIVSLTDFLNPVNKIDTVQPEQDDSFISRLWRYIAEPSRKRKRVE